MLSFGYVSSVQYIDITKYEATVNPNVLPAKRLFRNLTIAGYFTYICRFCKTLQTSKMPVPSLLNSQSVP